MADEGFAFQVEEKVLDKQELYKVSRAQERIFAAQNMLPENDTTYIFSRYIKTGKELDANRIRETLKKLFNRHESLRTGFQMTENGLFQKIHDADEVWIEEAVELSEIKNEVELSELKWDLSSPPLFRWKQEKDRVIFHWHHTINDGMGAAQFAREFVLLYNGGELEKHKIHQKEYAFWENKWITSPEYELKRSAWTERLTGLEDARELRIPIDGFFDRSSGNKAGRIVFDITKEMSERANALCGRSSATPYILFMSVFSLLLYKYAGQKKFIIGTVMRDKGEHLTESVLGMFVNTVPVAVTVTKDETFDELLKDIKETVLFARENQLVALEDIASDFENNGGIGRTRHNHLMFDVLFTKKEFFGELPKIDGASAELCFIDEEMPIYDISLQVGKGKGCYNFELVYDADLFDEACMVSLKKHYVNLIDSCLSSPGTLISDFLMVDEEERIWLLEHGKGRKVVSDDTTVVARIGHQAESYPQRQALIYNEEVFTYEKMWNTAGILAEKLVSIYSKQIGKRGEKKIVLISERGPAMIVSLLGILRSGAGYVPVSPGYPDERILYIIKDSKPDCVLIQGIKLSENVREALKDMHIPIINVDIRELGGSPVVGNTSTIGNALPGIKPEQIAYMIYTSGTTGNPKGVIVEHRQLSALLNAYEDVYTLDKEDTVLQFANYVFDQSIWEIFHILTKGGTLCLASEDHIKDPDLLAVYCEKCSVTVIMMTPGYLRLMDADKFPSVRLVDVGGEAPTRSLLSEWSVGERTVLNTYGPTETTVNASSYIYAQNGRIIDKNIGNTENVPIGRPAPGMEIYILDGKDLCGIGVPGELCIGGPQVARGYHEREELTEERFIDNPFGSGRLYRSGDLARFMPDGNILFMNRIDDQIKIRGFRIELGEIETVMRSFDMVDNAVVVLRNTSDGDKLLCGYYTLSEGFEEFDEGRIREALSEKLPEYMIPSVLVHVNEFKLTINGKIDRRALPDVNLDIIMTGKDRDIVLPSTREEKDCLDAFKKILGTDKISVLDDFLAMGGDSIKAIRIVSILRGMGYGLDAPSLLKNRTIRSLASHIERKEISTYKEFTVVSPTPVMKIFTGSHLANPSYYNQSAVLIINGHADVSGIENALNALVYSHGMLRMISDDNGNIKIRNRKSVPRFKISVYSETDETDREKIMNGIHSSLDPDHGVVMGAALFKGKEKDRLFLAFHHYVIDEVSWGIILSDLNILYEYVMKGTEHNDDYMAYMKVLPAPSVSFGEWSQSLWKYRELDAFEPERKYWIGLHDKIMSPVGKNIRTRLYERLGRSERKSTGSGTILAYVEQNIRDELFEQTHKRYGTRNDAIFIAALVQAAAFDDESASVVIQMESHGRGNIEQGIMCDRTVGWFTAVYPVLIKCHKDIDEQVIEVKELLTSIPNAGIGYGLLFDDLVDAGGLVFNYLGASDTGRNEMIYRSEEYSGIKMDPQNIEPGTISFNIRITDNGIEIECIYDDIYNSDRVDTFVSHYTEILKNIAQRTTENNRIYTQSDLCVNRLLSDSEWKTLTSVYSPDSIECVAELTSLQQGMLYRNMVDPESSAYLLQDRLTFRGRWDKELFELALQAIFIRFDALRIRFMYDGLEAPIQLILREGQLRSALTEVSGKSFEEIVSEDLIRGMDPSVDTMLRVTFNKDSEKHDEKELLITTHHCIIDGWSFPILTDTLMNYYRMLLKGVKADALKRMAEKESHSKCSYADFLKDRKDAGSNDKLQKWSEYLNDFNESTGIDGIGCSGEEGRTAEYEEFHINRNMDTDIRRYTEKHRITTSCFFGCVWGLLLGFENNVNDVVFGETVSGRDRNIDGLVDAVGMFISTIPVRIRWSGDDFVSDVMRRRQEDYYVMLSAADVPLDKIMSTTIPGSGLIHTLYVYENYPGSEADSNEHTLTLLHEEVDFPISIGIGEKDGFTVALQYDGAKYARSYVKLLLARYENIVYQIISGKDIRVSDIDILSKGEKEYMLGEISGVSGFISKHTVLDLIERTVTAFPDAIAVTMEDISISYAVLWNAACVLAEEIGYGEERFIAVYSDRGPEAIVAMLAVLLAGAAYVPITPDYPDERIRFLLNDCNACAVLRCAYPETESREEVFGKLGIRVIDVSDDLFGRSVKLKERFNEYHKLKNRLAYMIYTSGTTGEPKGVEIEHTALIQMIQSNINRLGAFDTVVLQAANYVFDASVMEIFVTLVSGGTVCIIPRKILTDSAEMARYCREKKVKVIVPTNALLQALDPAQFDHLRLISVGGDAANSETFNVWYEHTDMLVNDYGPTEACVNATVHIYKNEKKYPIPIGKPYDNKRIYVMQNDKLCGIGQRGEICIGGTGLARGYHNREELNRRVFRPNPFGEGRLYRTGDLGIFGTDGELRFAGRNDDQIKIRGYRIETGEIESRIKKHNAVKEAAVIGKKRDSGEAYLAAYIVWKNKPEPDSLKAYLSKSLPAYMIPAAITGVDSLPLTTSGKLDVRALPEPIREVDDTPAEGYFEQMVAELFESVLGIEKVGRNDSFFELGGSSIDLMRVVSGLSQYNIKVSDVVAAPTPAMLGERLLNGWNSMERNNKGMVLLQDGDKDKASIFCMPPSGGMSLCYLPFIRELNYPGRIYGFTDGKYSRFADMSINELSSYDPGSENLWEDTIDMYMDSISAVFKQGDILVGYSQGGVLAQLISCKLEKKGIGTGRIIMFEALPPGDEGLEDEKNLTREERLRTSVALFMGNTVTDKYIKIPDNISDGDYLKKCLKDIYGEDAVSSMFHTLYETYMVYSSNVLNRIELSDRAECMIDCILLDGKKGSGGEGYAETTENIWERYSKEKGRAFVVEGSFDEHLIFISKYRNLISCIVKDLIMK